MEFSPVQEVNNNNVERPCKRVKFDYDSSKIYFLKNHPDAKIPTRATSHSAGYDFYAPESVTIPPNTIGCVDTQIKVRIPHGHYLQLQSRSGHVKKHALTVEGGVIDEDYLGIIIGLICNHSDQPYTFNKGDRCFQGILLSLSKSASEEISQENWDSLETTDRNIGGFGSTGK